MRCGGSRQAGPLPLHYQSDCLCCRKAPANLRSNGRVAPLYAFRATRASPSVVLGPVDLTCSFVVVDTRRFDHPIVYCSPSFCTLTGYSASEVIGRNCRFLQAPFGNVQRGERRTHTSNEAVSHLKKCLVADKECQTSIVNYKKDGTPFINLLTVIPLPGGISDTPDEQTEYAYHVGFQVDLTDQPNAILDKLRHGSYLVNYSAAHADFARARQTQQRPQLPSTGRERRANSQRPVVMSEDLVQLIRDPRFIKSIPLSTSTVISPSPTTVNQGDFGANNPLHLLLLEATPDFIHVVSLKGNFLYVAPSVRRVLGYDPEEMVGKSIADYAHPDDVVPLTRELKESSATGSGPEGANSKINGPSGTNLQAASTVPRSVNLLFRARTKMGRYVWVECRGRLHIEPGKGRKAIVLSGRAREMVALSWADVRFAGGLARGRRQTQGSAESGSFVEQEVWGMIAGHGKETLTFLSVGKGSEDILGWSADELIGRSVMDVVLDEGTKNVLGSAVTNMRVYQPLPSQHHRLLATASAGTRVKRVQCALRKKNGGVADVWFIIYCSGEAEDGRVEIIDPGELRREAGLSISHAPLVYQIRLVKADTVIPVLEPKSVTMSQSSTIYVSPFSFQSSDSSSSSLAGAVGPVTPIPSLSPASTTRHDSVPLSLNIFQELGISRSSWQYELQQLRIANVRLREEFAVLETVQVDAGETATNPARLGKSTSLSSLLITSQATDGLVQLLTAQPPSFGHPGSLASIVDSHFQQQTIEVADGHFPISFLEPQHHAHQQLSHSGNLLDVDTLSQQHQELSLVPLHGLSYPRHPHQSPIIDCDGQQHASNNSAQHISLKRTWNATS